jgi:hypothetical protein
MLYWSLYLPPIFTLDACRHSGMIELEEAELTEGQGRALSGHATGAAYCPYARATGLRLGATGETPRTSADDGVDGGCSQGGAEGGALI